MTPVNDAISSVLRSLETIRIPAVNGEYDIHNLIAQAMRYGEIEFVHEARLGPRRRVDFLAGGVGIEVKSHAVARKLLLGQIKKYAESELIKAIIIVSPRQMDLPPSVNGKPVISFGLSRLWGVALP